MTGCSKLRLDRMAIEEAGPEPTRMAAAIHEQLALSHGPTPIRDIAKALDIVDIRKASLHGFEAALVALPDRNVGSIVVNATSSDQRQRFSVAHELGHFLNVWHRPIQSEEGGDFVCRKEDMADWKVRSGEAFVHALQEAQANRFAIELLAPRKFFAGFLHGVPDLDAALRLSSALKLSREATARRYVELHPTPTGLMFSANGQVRYFVRHDDFPAFACRMGMPTPLLPQPTGDDHLSDHVDADWRDWLYRAPDGDLVIQTLHQQSSFAITLLAIDGSAKHDEE